MGERPACAFRFVAANGSHNPAIRPEGSESVALFEAMSTPGADYIDVMAALQIIVTDIEALGRIKTIRDGTLDISPVFPVP